MFEFRGKLEERGSLRKRFMPLFSRKVMNRLEVNLRKIYKYKFEDEGPGWKALKPSTVAARMGRRKHGTYSRVPARASYRGAHPIYRWTDWLYKGLTGKQHKRFGAIRIKRPATGRFEFGVKSKYISALNKRSKPITEKNDLKRAMDLMR